MINRHYKSTYQPVNSLKYCKANPERFVILKEPSCLNCGRSSIIQHTWQKHKPFCKMKCGYEWSKKNSSDQKWCYACGWYTKNERDHIEHEILA
jgi:hypothetical protein